MSLLKIGLGLLGAYAAVAVVDEYVHPLGLRRANILRVLREPHSSPFGDGHKVLGDTVHVGDRFDTTSVATGSGAFTALSDAQAVSGGGPARIIAKLNVPTTGIPSQELVTTLDATAVTKIF